MSNANNPNAAPSFSNVLSIYTQVLDAVISTTTSSTTNATTTRTRTHTGRWKGPGGGGDDVDLDNMDGGGGRLRAETAVFCLAPTRRLPYKLVLEAFPLRYLLQKPAYAVHGGQKELDDDDDDNNDSDDKGQEQGHEQDTARQDLQNEEEDRNATCSSAASADNTHSAIPNPAQAEAEAESNSGTYDWAQHQSESQASTPERPRCHIPGKHGHGHADLDPPDLDLSDINLPDLDHDFPDLDPSPSTPTLEAKPGAAHQQKRHGPELTRLAVLAEASARRPSRTTTSILGKRRADDAAFDLDLEAAEDDQGGRQGNQNLVRPSSRLLSPSAPSPSPGVAFGLDDFHEHMVAGREPNDKSTTFHISLPPSEEEPEPEQGRGPGRAADHFVPDLPNPKRARILVDEDQDQDQDPQQHDLKRNKTTINFTQSPSSSSMPPPPPFALHDTQFAAGNIEIANLQDNEAQLLATTIKTLSVIFNALDSSVYIVDTALLEVREGGGGNNGPATSSLQSLRGSRLYEITRLHLQRHYPTLRIVLLPMNVIHGGHGQGQGNSDGSAPAGAPHWVLAWFDLAERTAHLADSAMGPGASLLVYQASAKAFMDEFLLSSSSSTDVSTSAAKDNNNHSDAKTTTNNDNHHSPRSSSWTWRVQDQCAQQTDGHNCGVFMLVFALHTVLHRPLPHRLNPSLWRKVFVGLLGGPSSSSSSSSHAGAVALDDGNGDNQVDHHPPPATRAGDASSLPAPEPAVTAAIWFIDIVPDPLALSAPPGLSNVSSSGSPCLSCHGQITNDPTLPSPEQQSIAASDQGLLMKNLLVSSPAIETARQQYKLYSDRILHLETLVADVAQVAALLDPIQLAATDPNNRQQQISTIVNRTRSELQHRKVLVEALETACQPGGAWAGGADDSLLGPAQAAADKDMLAHAKQAHATVQVHRRFWVELAKALGAALGCARRVLADVVPRVKADLEARILVNERLVGQSRVILDRVEELVTAMEAFGRED